LDYIYHMMQCKILQRIMPMTTTHRSDDKMS
jgi:hypothetical protein